VRYVTRYLIYSAQTTHTETGNGKKFWVMDHTLLQKSRIYSSEKLLPVVDFGRSWTTVVLLAKLCSVLSVIFFDVQVKASASLPVFRTLRRTTVCSILSRFIAIRSRSIMSISRMRVRWSASGIAAHGPTLPDFSWTRWNVRSPAVTTPTRPEWPSWPVYSASPSHEYRSLFAANSRTAVKYVNQVSF